MTVAIDCAIIAPAAIASGVLIWRRHSWGYLMAVPLLILLALLAPLIAAQTVSQLTAGVVLTPGQIVGPVGGFVVLALAAVVVLWSLLRRVGDNSDFCSPKENALLRSGRASVVGSRADNESFRPWRVSSENPRS